MIPTIRNSLIFWSIVYLLVYLLPEFFHISLDLPGLGILSTIVYSLSIIPGKIVYWGLAQGRCSEICTQELYWYMVEPITFALSSFLIGFILVLIASTLLKYTMQIFSKK